MTEGIRNGITDAELTKEYGLSGVGLKRLFYKLLKAMSNGSRQIEVEMKE